MFEFSAFSLYDAVYLAIGGVTILGALGVVLFRNIVYSALSLVLTFLGVAAIYFQLNAGFLGVIQILVYAGAISVLIIFAVMLVMDKEARRTNLPTPRVRAWFTSGTISAMMLASIIASISFTEWPKAALQGADDSLGMLAELMMGDYVIAFEAAAILLLVAVIGAIILAKGVENK